MRRAVLAPLTTAAAATAAAVVVLALDPYEPGHFPTCPVLALTGFFCTGCGTMRAVHSLLHLDVAGAWDMNPLLLLLAPFAVATWVAWTVRAWSGRPRRWAAPPWAIATVLVVLVAFTVLRNVPALGPWLAP
ncbi:DUF2752 domain-containing protein [Actinotalea ferrariae]|uniref:DUF2752 domain-containing protein n=1 Tax=Actinotalea ferrariae TaxID=1386098 RepID=UPI001C8C44E3|nr:DUF2752 domain-containing protein [Actinotalea ferrariae]MBX9244213.1 DUF2752 domain-containing protein [Actinotalea ferrariae]